MNGKGSRPRPMDRKRWEAAPWPPTRTHHEVSKRHLRSLDVRYFEAPEWSQIPWTDEAVERGYRIHPAIIIRRKPRRSP